MPLSNIIRMTSGCRTQIASHNRRPEMCCSRHAQFVAAYCTCVSFIQSVLRPLYVASILSLCPNNWHGGSAHGIILNGLRMLKYIWYLQSTSSDPEWQSMLPLRSLSASAIQERIKQNKLGWGWKCSGPAGLRGGPCGSVNIWIMASMLHL